MIFRASTPIQMRDEILSYLMWRKSLMQKNYTLFEKSKMQNVIQKQIILLEGIISDIKNSEITKKE